MLCGLQNRIVQNWYTGKGENKMKVAIIMGSNSDWPILEPAEKTLKEFGVEVEVAIIAAAGLAAHLGGVIAAYTTLPVIGIPISGGPLKGMDALLSFVQMPSGVPVATMAIDGAKNAAIFAVEILAGAHPELVEKLAAYRVKMQEEVAAKAAKLAAVRGE